MHATREEFRVRSFDADASGLLAPPRLLVELLETAGQSADSLGVGIAELETRGLTWVLARLELAVDEAFRLGDVIEVETWPSGLVRSGAWRDFRVWKAGRRAARGTSLWFVLDRETRAVVRPQELFPEALHAPLEHELPVSKTLPEFVGSATVEQTFAVRRADIDFNQHITAASYFGWALETVPESIWIERRLGTLGVHFMEEGHLGDTVTAGSQLRDGHEILHRITRQSDGHELCRLRTTWVER